MFLETNEARKSYLSESSGLGVGARIGKRVLVVVAPVAVPGNDDDAENLGKQHSR